MPVHVQTGGKIDVVYDYDGDRKVLLGIQPWGGELLPLEQPQALVDVLQTVLNEIAVQEINALTEGD